MKRFEPIGKYIHLVDVRNSDLSVKKLLGIASNKTYIPSVANIIGTDLSKYKVIKEGQFSCNLMHVSRDGVVPVALYYGSPAIVSPAYPVFEVNNTEELLPEYLHLYLSSSEFDREAVFHAMVGVRGSLIWEDFLSIKIPIVDIHTQRLLVDEFNTIQKKYDDNNLFIDKLEELLTLIFRRSYVENIGAYLSHSWKIGTISDIAEIYSGKSITDKIDIPDAIYKVPVAGATGIIGYAKTANQNTKLLTTGRVGTLGVVNRYYESIWAADNVIVVTSKYFEFTCQLLKWLDYSKLTKLGVQSLITKSGLENYEVVVPSMDFIVDFEEQVAPIVEYIRQLRSENMLLSRIKSLLLSKIS